jgi:hypothetical protein
LEALHPVANRLERHLTVVRHVAQILDKDNTAAQVKRALRRYLNRLEQQAPRRGRGAQTGHFVDHLVRVANSYWSGLFHAYQHPHIPRTNNGIEGFFGSSKHSVRCITGRASTAGGKLESGGEIVIRAQALMQILSKTELQRHLDGVSDAAFVAGKRDLVRIREPALQRRSIQRRPEAFLERALTEWLGQ